MNFEKTKRESKARQKETARGKEGEVAGGERKVRSDDETNRSLSQKPRSRTIEEHQENAGSSEPHLLDYVGNCKSGPAWKKDQDHFFGRQEPGGSSF